MVVNMRLTGDGTIVGEEARSTLQTAVAGDAGTDVHDGCERKEGPRRRAEYRLRPR